MWMATGLQRASSNGEVRCRGGQEGEELRHMQGTKGRRQGGREGGGWEEEEEEARRKRMRRGRG
jgi:hypothetical protein